MKTVLRNAVSTIKTRLILVVFERTVVKSIVGHNRYKCCGAKRNNRPWIKTYVLLNKPHNWLSGCKVSPTCWHKGVRLVGCFSKSTSKFVFWSGRPVTSHNQFALSQAQGACDQPLQNLQRIHYRVSGCSTSRDHVPILYDILYWGVEVSWGWGVVRSFTEAEVRGRTGSLSRSESRL